MLKNWTVITQPVRLASDGLMIRERYLLNTKHANHKNTEHIISIYGCAKTSHQIALAGEGFRLKQQLNNRKGGRPLSSYAMEYCLTLPKGYQPTPKQWQSVVRDCCIALAKHCKLNKTEFAQFRQQIRAVVHQQYQGSKSGSGDHAHLVIGKVVGIRNLKELQQKKATKLIKQAFNQSALKHIGIDYRSYAPEENKKGKRLGEWQYKYEKSQVALEMEKQVLQMQKQFTKWLTAIEESDERQKRRQKNRLMKTYDSIDHRLLSSKQSEEIENIRKKIL
ncbi:hypothetical protein ACSTD6_16640 [Vibrio vulnificus]|uniref:hypothetical protein n=1 Tax=Vibrio vulnificus TaxID=672 RepID=UPI003EDACDAC